MKPEVVVVWVSIAIVSTMSSLLALLAIAFLCKLLWYAVFHWSVV